MKKTSDYKTRDLIYNKYNGKCAYCGVNIEKNKFHIDHIKPKRRHIKGYYGKDEIDNYNPSCVSCNSSKASLELEQWRKELKLKEERLYKYESNYRICVRFGLIKKTNKPIVFYFEKMEVSNG